MAFVRTEVKAVLSESAEYFSNMVLMFFGIVGVDKNVVEIDNDTDIKQVTENVVHEALESGRSVRKTKWHNEPFKRAIASTKSSLPFVTFSNAD